MKNVTTTYVKRLFWIALLPYLIGGGIFLTSASDRLFEKPSTLVQRAPSLTIWISRE
ncbi:MAG: hypothetical protein R3B93_13880 [Bacteroidia bacterium]